MHPRTREVRKPDSGIDPRGSGSGQPPLLQGFLKHRKPAAAPKAPPSAAPAEPAEPEAPAAPPASKTRRASTSRKPAAPRG